MNENKTMNEEKNNMKETQISEEAKTLLDPRERMRRLGKGTLELASPIRAGGEDIGKLNFDFTRMTGLEMAECMDRDLKASNIFKVTHLQALHLFAAAAAKATDKVDSTDILERLSFGDAVKAVQVATAFFIASSQAGNARITTE